jgi:hypothetical protein
MVYNIAEIKYTSFYPVLLQKRHTLCTQGNLLPLDLKDGFLADLLTYYCIMHYGGGGVSSREQRSRARSGRGGVSENWIAGSAAASLFFLTAIAIATRPFKFRSNSVSYTSSSFVSSIHSFG